MSDPKGPSNGFLRKVAKFVANPTTDWRDLNAKPEDALKDGGYDKEELKAMIERKQRNDFVRRRELDALRKIRREGLTGEGLAGLQLSHLDDSEPPRLSRTDGEVKAKIDAIERQMVGENYGLSQRTTTPAALPSRPMSSMDVFSGQTTLPGDALAAPTARPGLSEPPSSKPLDLRASPFAPSRPAAPMPPDRRSPPRSERGPLAWTPEPAPPSRGAPPAAPAPAARRPGPGASTLSGMVRSEPAPLGAPATAGGSGFSSSLSVDVNEIGLDPDLDEAVIAFANADFDQAESSLSGLIAAGGRRAQHAETWLVLFDFYRAVGQHGKFESLAVDYAERFGWSAPQWFSLPKIVAEAAAAQQASAATPRPARVVGSVVGWICPAVVDMEAVRKLRTQTLQLPMPWVLDWSGLKAVEPEACGLLRSLLRVWARDAIQMQWLGGDHLEQVLTEATPVSVRDVDPAMWLLRLEVLRLMNRPDQFDVAAIDYCVTYEVSPPSWEAAKCSVRVGNDPASSGPMSVISEMSTGFVESQTHDDPSLGQIATVELSGQLVGDISATLRSLQAETGGAGVVSVNCARLIRVDFIAAGDLLNWVLQRHSEGRALQFIDAHRLVALFFGAMGISEHAKVKVHNV